MSPGVAADLSALFDVGGIIGEFPWMFLILSRGNSAKCYTCDVGQLAAWRQLTNERVIAGVLTISYCCNCDVPRQKTDHIFRCSQWNELVMSNEQSRAFMPHNDEHWFMYYILISTCESFWLLPSSIMQRHLTVYSFRWHFGGCHIGLSWRSCSHVLCDAAACRTLCKFLPVFM